MGVIDMKFRKFNPYVEAVSLLSGDIEHCVSTERDIETILEDADSPIGRKYQEQLYQSIIDKGHIDFEDIPQ